ncbi:ArsR/SmtB family transcription factor [Streptococcus dentiloxodontae]
MTTKQFSIKDDESWVKIFKALADPVRLKIIRILYRKQGELSCGEIGQVLDMSKSAVSYHFKTLREAGLTSTRKVGQNKFVQLNNETFHQYLPGFLDLIND